MMDIKLPLQVLLFLGFILMWRNAGATGSEDLVSQRPPGDGPTRIEVSFYFIDLMEVIDVEETFGADIFFIARWKDSRLKGENERVVPTSGVWMPTVLVFNKRDASIDLPQVVTIQPDGTVIYRQRIMGTFASPLDLRKFPLDSQTLYIELVSYGKSTDEVILVEAPGYGAGRNNDFSIRNWQIGKFQLIQDGFHPMPGARELSRLTVSLDVKRYWRYYLIQMLVPLFLIVAMSGIPFWINPEVIPTRISTSVTTVLTLIAYRFMFGSLVPKLPYLTLLDHLLFGATVLVAASLFTLAIQARMVKEHEPAVKKIDRVARVAHPLIFAIILMFTYLSYS
jgi:hypothetical protein